jgi:hypothetical protein
MHNYVSTIRRYTYVPLIPRLWNHSYLKDELYYYYVRVVYVHVREGRFQYNNVLHSQGRKWEPASNREHLCTHSSVSTIDVDLRTYAQVESSRRDTCNREHVCENGNTYCTYQLGTQAYAS